MTHSRVLFAASMLGGDTAKLAFLRVHELTVRGAFTKAMIGLTSVYAAGYAATIALKVLAR